MSFKDDLAKARESRPEPVYIEVGVGDNMYSVEVFQLDGMDWSAIMADATPTSAEGAALGYEPSAGALLACKRHGKLLDSDGGAVDMEPVKVDGKVVSEPWDNLFAELSGVDARGIASAWWALNMRDPNKRVVALKKSLAAGDKTSLS